MEQENQFPSLDASMSLWMEAWPKLQRQWHLFLDVFSGFDRCALLKVFKNLPRQAKGMIIT